MEKLLDYPASFKKDEIINLDASQFETLSGSGVCFWTKEPKSGQSSEEIFYMGGKTSNETSGATPEADQPSWLTIAYDSSKSSFFFEFSPEEDLNLFLGNSYLVNYNPVQKQVSLRFKTCLKDLLLEGAGNVVSCPEIEISSIKNVNHSLSMR